MGKEDKIGNEAFRWARAKVFNLNKTSVGRAIAFGCAPRCHLSVHSLAMTTSCWGYSLINTLKIKKKIGRKTFGELNSCELGVFQS